MSLSLLYTVVSTVVAFAKPPHFFFNQCVGLPSLDFLSRCQENPQCRLFSTLDTLWPTLPSSLDLLSTLQFRCPSPSPLVKHQRPGTATTPSVLWAPAGGSLRPLSYGSPLGVAPFTLKLSMMCYALRLPVVHTTSLPSRLQLSTRGTPYYLKGK
jgi:hypothetical protein